MNITTQMLEPGCRDFFPFWHTDISKCWVIRSGWHSCWMGLKSGFCADQSNCHTVTNTLLSKISFYAAAFRDMATRFACMMTTAPTCWNDAPSSKPAWLSSTSVGTSQLFSILPSFALPCLMERGHGSRPSQKLQSLLMVCRWINT